MRGPGGRAGELDPAGAVDGHRPLKAAVDADVAEGLVVQVDAERRKGRRRRVVVDEAADAAVDADFGAAGAARHGGEVADLPSVVEGEPGVVAQLVRRDEEAAEAGVEVDAEAGRREADDRAGVVQVVVVLDVDARSDWKCGVVRAVPRLQGAPNGGAAPRRWPARRRRLLRLRRRLVRRLLRLRWRRRLRRLLRRRLHERLRAQRSRRLRPRLRLLSRGRRRRRSQDRRLLLGLACGLLEPGEQGDAGSVKRGRSINAKHAKAPSANDVGAGAEAKVLQMPNWLEAPAAEVDAREPRVGLEEALDVGLVGRRKTKPGE